MPKLNKTNYQDTTKELIRAVKNQRLDLQKGKTGIGKAMYNMRQKSFQNRKLKILKAIGQSNAKTSVQVAKALSNVTGQMAGAYTADSILGAGSRRSSDISAQNALDKWTSNFSGNPDTDSGANGNSQTGSTGELGG